MKIKMVKDTLVVDAENKEERCMLNTWYDNNPVSEDDGIKLTLICLEKEKEDEK